MQLLVGLPPSTDRNEPVVVGYCDHVTVPVGWPPCVPLLVIVTVQVVAYVPDAGMITDAGPQSRVVVVWFSAGLGVDVGVGDGSGIGVEVAPVDGVGVAVGNGNESNVGGVGARLGPRKPKY